MCICYIYTIQMISYNLVYSIYVCSITYTVIHLHFCWRTSATHNLVGNLQVLPCWRVLWWSPKRSGKKASYFSKTIPAWGIRFMAPRDWGGSWHRYIARHSAWCCRGNSWHGSRFRHRGGGVGKSKSCWSKCHLTWIHSLKINTCPREKGLNCLKGKDI